MTRRAVHEFPSTHIPYEELMIELNIIKAQLPKKQWKNLYFEVETKLELGTYHEYQALTLYLEED